MHILEKQTVHLFTFITLSIRKYFKNHQYTIYCSHDDVSIGVTFLSVGACSFRIKVVELSISIGITFVVNTAVVARLNL